MPVTTGTSFEPLTGRNEPYAEFDELMYRGDSYVLRVTALRPYKDYANGGDDLRCHIDFLNVTRGISGRFTDTIIPGRDFGEPDGARRRHSTIRHLKWLVDNVTPDPSPVYP